MSKSVSASPSPGADHGFGGHASLELPMALQRAKQWAKWLDTAWTIPIINRRVGLDPLLSLIPYAGSVVSGVLSFYLLWTARSLNLPGHIVLQMLVNIAIDVTIGELPIVGTLLDAMWRSNTKNVKLLEKAYREHGRTTIIVN
jgi:hypothetical protein